MTRRAVYDAMVFFQWGALPTNRQHATVRALYDGTIRLCLSPELIEEVRDLLGRPNIRAKSPQLTDERVDALIAEAIRHSDWFEDVPQVFSFLADPDDDHLFNLAIVAQASFLVTWENRLLALGGAQSAEARRLRELAPSLRIVSPKELSEELKRGD